MVYKKQKDKITTVRMKRSTKKQLDNLNFSKKGMSYEEIILELIKRNKKKR